MHCVCFLNDSLPGPELPTHRFRQINPVRLTSTHIARIHTRWLHSLWFSLFDAATTAWCLVPIVRHANCWISSTNWSLDDQLALTVNQYSRSAFSRWSSFVHLCLMRNNLTSSVVRRHPELLWFLLISLILMIPPIRHFTERRTETWFGCIKLVSSAGRF